MGDSILMTAVPKMLEPSSSNHMNSGTELRSSILRNAHLNDRSFVLVVDQRLNQDVGATGNVCGRFLPTFFTFLISLSSFDINFLLCRTSQPFFIPNFRVLSFSFFQRYDDFRSAPDHVNENDNTTQCSIYRAVILFH